jgi:hypothetical protein
MNRRFRAWVDSPRNAIVTVAYQVVALLVTIVGLISRQWRRMTQYSIKCWLYIRRKRGNGNGAYSKGKRPKEPRVLGVVLFQRSFRAQENQALSRLLTWCVVLYDASYLSRHWVHTFNMALQGCTTWVCLVYIVLSI